jgi:hypothetical protein
MGMIHSAMYGPLAALYSELFSTRARYTGASLGYQIAGLGAGLAPVVFAAVLSGAGSTTLVSATIAAFCLVAVGCILALSESSRTDLTAAEPASEQPAAGQLSA